MDNIEFSQALNIKYDAQGLIVAVVQDASSKEILMVAYMNQDAVELCITTGHAHYFSRSRNKIWKKGETSGNIQEVVELKIDCDQDAILMFVNQKSGACHNGYRTCFYRKIISNTKLKFDDDVEQMFNPNDVY